MISLNMGQNANHLKKWYMYVILSWTVVYQMSFHWERESWQLWEDTTAKHNAMCLNHNTRNTTRTTRLRSAEYYTTLILNYTSIFLHVICNRFQQLTFKVFRKNCFSIVSKGIIDSNSVMAFLSTTVMSWNKRQQLSSCIQEQLLVHRYCRHAKKISVDGTK